MGLRINNNIEALNAQRSLQKSNFALSKSLQKLSSGFRINVAADDPAGLVISENLRSQLSGLKQAVENSQNAANMISTAEGALTEMNDILKSMRQLAVHAASTGTSDREQIAADQAQIDSAIRSVDRIANTTKFAGKSLLNGSQDYIHSSVNAAVFAAQITDLSVNRAQIIEGSAVTVNVNITTAALRASAAAITANNQAGYTNMTLAISGSLGTEFVQIAAGATTQDILTAINAVTANTGVYVEAGTFELQSVSHGSNEFVKMSEVTNTTYNADRYAVGVDTTGTVNGQKFTADGLSIQVTTGFFEGEITVASTVVAGALQAFQVTDGGMKFQLGDTGRPNEQEHMGIQSAHSTFLGNGVDGFLSSLRTGSDNDLFSNPERAIDIIDSAIKDVSSLRARLGAFQKNTLLTNVNSLNVAIENITNSESRIRDANIANETTEFTKNQILVQSGTSILAQANVASQSVLQLLG